MLHSITGVFPVFQTPFREDFSIDSEVLAAEIEWMYGHDIDGIVMAMVSEVIRTSPASAANTDSITDQLSSASVRRARASQLGSPITLKRSEQPL